MSAAITFRGFLGDRERDFALSGAMVAELERKTGTGIGALIQRVGARDFRLSDLSEVIRLGLIGAHEAPAEAARLVGLYVEDRPVEEFLALALGILEARWFGRSVSDPAPALAPVEPAPQPAPVVDAPFHPGIGSD